MAPVRRYLRITKYSILEIRIYLDNPAHTSTWFLRPSDPALPRIISAIQPYVLPKLREENERARVGKGKGKKAVKDVVQGEDFEVSIFLTESSTRHSLLTKRKRFDEREGGRLKSNSGKLTGWIRKAEGEKLVDVENEDEDEDDGGMEEQDAPVIREENEGETVDLDDVPDVAPVEERSSRKRRRVREDESLFVNEEEERSENEEEGITSGQADDKKKMALNTEYDGFSIYGRILCLVVKRKGGKAIMGSEAPATSQHMLETWVSTQANQDQMDDEENEG